MNGKSFSESNVIREKHQRESIKREVKQMRKNLPVYSIDEIREYKLPYDEALLINLEEKGYISSAAFIKQLIDCQTEAREQAGPTSNLWLRPQLKYSKPELKILSDALCKAETFYKTDDHHSECMCFLQVAIYFAFLHQDWWWLGEQLLLQSIDVAVAYSFSGGKYEALSRFAYAKFLIENVKEFDNAQEQLELARKLTINHGWDLNLYFPELTDKLLYLQINRYIYMCHIRDANILMSKNDIVGAIEVATLAKKRAADACYPDGEAQALILKGQCQMIQLDSNNAISCFQRALNIQEKHGTKEGECICMIHLSKAYLKENKTKKALELLLNLKKTAVKNKLYTYQALAYKNLGEFFLKQSEPRKAHPALIQALTIFEDHFGSGVKSIDVDEIRILEATASGLQLLPKYLEILIYPDKAHMGVSNLMKIVDWKDSRAPFWMDDDDLTSYKCGSFHDVIRDVLRSGSETRIQQLRLERKGKHKSISVQTLVEQQLMTTAIGRFAKKLGIPPAIYLHDNKDNFAQKMSDITDQELPERKVQDEKMISMQDLIDDICLD